MQVSAARLNRMLKKSILDFFSHDLAEWDSPKSHKLLDFSSLAIWQYNHGLHSRLLFQQPAKICVLALLAATAFLTASPLSSYAQAPRLDAESAECIRCHEGSVSGAETPMVCHNGSCDHPIGVDYSALAMRDPGLKRPERLDPALRLIDGKMGCTTCHVPYNEYDHRMLAEKRRTRGMPDPMLVMDNRGSAMCLACHNK